MAICSDLRSGATIGERRSIASVLSLSRSWRLAMAGAPWRLTMAVTQHSSKGRLCICLCVPIDNFLCFRRVSGSGLHCRPLFENKGFFFTLVLFIGPGFGLFLVRIQILRTKGKKKLVSA
nr:hypothetical protein Itr_chr01CG10930 [Ipomoea trifida]